MSQALASQSPSKCERFADRGQFFCDVVMGLSQAQKTLQPKYFYDEMGSEFFDQICQLEEYYPYKTELRLLPQVAASLANVLEGEFALVEFGAGSLLKVKPLFSCIEAIKKFIPIDISGEHLVRSSQLLQQEYPNIVVEPQIADFTQPLDIKSFDGLQALGFFPGSTIGNFTPDAAEKFLHNARNILGAQSYLLIGVDTKKSPEILHRAYNDALGVTAKFNLNILQRINRSFDTQINVDHFEHYAFYNAAKGCVEMHLVCREACRVHLDDVEITFDEGESIHTESSYKYTPKEFSQLAKRAGWNVEQAWMAKDDMFSMYLLKNCA